VPLVSVIPAPSELITQRSKVQIFPPQPISFPSSFVTSRCTRRRIPSSATRSNCRCVFRVVAALQPCAPARRSRRRSDPLATKAPDWLIRRPSRRSGGTGTRFQASFPVFRKYRGPEAAARAIREAGREVRALTKRPRDRLAKTQASPERQVPGIHPPPPPAPEQPPAAGCATVQATHPASAPKPNIRCLQGLSQSGQAHSRCRST